ncbi:hypothetical protein B0H10DRAFT_2220505 [Mycena sp. CBHHK59/15]|nr:hypothetical protein B0H10DRAFT_2220505 [Mycena sp. CBHHK59/15]
MDFDYKHLFKRLCKLLCSKEGILVNGVVINKSLIAQWLERLTGHDWSEESIHALLNPKDPQDVPRAVKLLTLVADLRHLDTSEFAPSESNTHRALSVLGEMFDALLEPFINPTMSLSEQITSLVKFAHLSCALLLKHEFDFISNQLYGDLQCMVKNAVFKVAHTKVLNPMLKVFICLLVMEVDELRQRFGSTLQIDEIFRRRPELEQHARWLRGAFDELHAASKRPNARDAGPYRACCANASYIGRRIGHPRGSRAETAGSDLERHATAIPLRDVPVFLTSRVARWLAPQECRGVYKGRALASDNQHPSVSLRTLTTQPTMQFKVTFLLLALALVTIGVSAGNPQTCIGSNCVRNVGQGPQGSCECAGTNCKGDTILGIVIGKCCSTSNGYCTTKENCCDPEQECKKDPNSQDAGSRCLN